jgi:hypothetical protein
MSNCVTIGLILVSLTSVRSPHHPPPSLLPLLKKWFLWQFLWHIYCLIVPKSPPHIYIYIYRCYNQWHFDHHLCLYASLSLYQLILLKDEHKYIILHWIMIFGFTFLDSSMFQIDSSAHSEVLVLDVMCNLNTYYNWPDKTGTAVVMSWHCSWSHWCFVPGFGSCAAVCYYAYKLVWSTVICIRSEIIW